MLNLLNIANKKRSHKPSKVDETYNKSFNKARLNWELIAQEEKFSVSTRGLIESQIQGA